MTNWDSPTKDSQYLAVLDDLKARDVDAGTMATPTNPPPGFKRWNSAARRFEEWSGTAWAALPTADAWIDYAHVPTYVSATSFRVPGDVTALYTVGRRVRATISSGLRYGAIASATYDGVNGWTLLGLALDSGSLGATLSAVALSVLDETAAAVPVLPLRALPTVDIAHGGTGAGTASAALVNLGVPGHTVDSRTTTGADAAGDRGKVLVCINQITRTVPAASAAGSGATLTYVNAGDAAVTLARTGTDTIGGKAGWVLYPGEALQLTADVAGNLWRVTGSVGGAIPRKPVSRTTGYSIDAVADGGRLQRCSGTLPITLPQAAAVPAGWSLPVINVGSGVVTIVRSGTDLIGGAASRDLRPLDAVTLISDGVSSWDVTGQAAAGGAGIDGFAAQILDIF